MSKQVELKIIHEIEKLEKAMLEMFQNPEPKVVNLLGENRIKIFKEVYLKMLNLLKNGNLPIHKNYLGDNTLAKSIYEKKYYLKSLDGKLIEKRPEYLFLRVSSFIASAEEDVEKALKFAKKFYYLMYEGYFMPAGRVLAGAGDLYRAKTLANCFVSMIEDDSIEGIYKAAYEAARTYSYGGGIGIDVSVLRPKGSRIHNAAITSTGSVSFLELYSLTTGLIGQEGRRGALMLTIDVKHPDIFDFIKCKQTPNWVTSQIVEQLKFTGMFNEIQLREIEKQVMENTQVRFANISIKVSNEFMKAVEEQMLYGSNKILVYKKKQKGIIRRIDNIKDVHYSYGIPSKNINNYELIRVFENIEELNDFLIKEYKELGIQIKEEDLKDEYKRDIFGDYVIELPNKDYDLAIKYSGDFLLYFSSDKTGEIRKLIKAKEIWNLFIESNYKTAEPGIMFWDRMKSYSPSDYVGFPIVTTNPCAEVPLEDGGACNLGSINLARIVDNPFTSYARINKKKLKKIVKYAIRFMDNVIYWNILLHPLQKQREASKNTRRIGLGVMGIADMFFELGLDYDSPEALKLLDRLMYYLANLGYKYSALLAKEKGKLNINYEKYVENPYFKEVLHERVKKLILKYGIRNIAIFSIAPTGTISNITKSFEYNGKNYIGVSGGIEPVFDMFYYRRTESFDRNVLYKVFHSTIKAYIDMKNLEKEVQEAKDLKELKKYLPSYFFRTAHYIDPFKRVEIQAIAQRYIDHSISSTINLPEDIEPELLSKLYFYAWKAGLKSVTVYREGSRFPILSREKEKTKFFEIKNKKFKIKDGNNEYVVKGDDVIELPDGSLTTVYHILLKRGELK